VAERAAEIERARSAVERRSWAEAFDLFRDLESPDFPPEDWERYADAAWCFVHPMPG
jgi:hypothetical protein